MRLSDNLSVVKIAGKLDGQCWKQISLVMLNLQEYVKNFRKFELGGKNSLKFFWNFELLELGQESGLS